MPLSGRYSHSNDDGDVTGFNYTGSGALRGALEHTNTHNVPILYKFTCKDEAASLYGA